jgi:putative SOS response-associated peptidase YedK
MCRRYVLAEQITTEREFLPTVVWWKFAPKFNVAPGQYVPSIRVHQGETEGVMLRWGMIPSWVEAPPVGAPQASVQSAHVERSKIFRAPWLGSQRCILPLAGFYTWRLTEGNYRQPFFVRLLNRPIFGVAALWDRWVSDEDDVIESCSIICVEANELLSGLGAEPGMPAILRRNHYRTWLHGTPMEAKTALRSYGSRWMEAYRVSPRINATDVDDPGLIRVAS